MNPASQAVDVCRRIPPATEAPASGLTCVLLYRDRSCAARAVQLLEEWSRNCADSEPLFWKPWRFDLLSFPVEHDEAVDCAQNADLIVVATAASDPLPSQLQRWLEAALRGSRETPRQVVAILEGRQSGSPAERDLRRATEETGAGLLLRLVTPTAGERSHLELGLDQRTTTVSDILEEILRQTDHPTCPRLN